MKFSRLAVHALALLSLAASNNNLWGALGEDVAEASAPETTETATATSSIPADAESFEYEAEVNRMLDIVINSLYQNKDIFIRELISNASDALDKFKYLSLTEPDTYKTSEDVPMEIKMEFDKDFGTFTIRDTGIGMSRDEMIANLGTVARSGTTKFMESLDEGATQDISQIGQFGVGFYSAFLVADRVKVASKNPNSDKQYVWESENGASKFNIYEDPRGNSLGRGTEITLYLKEDALEYSEDYKVTELVKHYSEFVMHPLYLRTMKTTEVEDEDVDEDAEADEDSEASDEDEMEVGEDEDAEEEDEKKMKTVEVESWDIINENPALWRREKDSISDEEYQNFYGVLSKDEGSQALTWNHFTAEGNINFKSLLYLQEALPNTFRMGNVDKQPGGMKLYVRRVLISDDFDLMPRYLGFIWGVVDSDDLPLNVNRESLQESKIITVIRKKLVRKAIEMIRSLIKDDEKAAKKVAEKEVEIDADGNVIESEDDEDDEPVPQKYNGWYEKFSPSVKLGVIEDEANRSKLLKLLRFKSSKSGGDYVSLEQYIENKKDWQDEIYVLAGIDQKTLEKSPFLNIFKEKDVEVLYLTDPIDEYVFQYAKEFDNHKIKHVSAEGIKFKDEDQDLVKRREVVYKKQFKPLTKWLKKLLGVNISSVVISKRLGDSAAIVSSGEYGNTANMERIMRAQALQHGQGSAGVSAMKVLEINPRHPLILKLLEGCPPEKKDDDDEAFEVSPEILDSAFMLFDIATMNGGFSIISPGSHTKRATTYLQHSLDVESLNLVAEIDPPIEDDEEDDGAQEEELLEKFNMADFDGNFDGIDLDFD